MHLAFYVDNTVGEDRMVYDREIQLSGFGKAVEVVVMAPDNLSKRQQREFKCWIL